MKNSIQSALKAAWAAVSAWGKENRGYCLLTACAAVLLLFSFWFGGNSPDARGWTLSPEAEASAAALPAEDSEPESPAEEPAPEENQPGGEAEQAAETPEPEKGSDSVPALQDAQPSQSGTRSKPQTNAQSKPQAKPQSSAQSKPQSPSQSTSRSADAVYSRSQGMVLDAQTGQDAHSTDPVPVGKPVPVDPEDAVVTSATYHCTLSISCAAILEHPDWLDPEKAELVPEDGWLLPPTTVAFQEGESVFQLLQRCCRERGIHMEFTQPPLYHSAYIEGIGNLYEFDCGELSGWMYRVNDWFPNYGCSRYRLQDGDKVVWAYTCTLGRDIGGSNAANAANS